MYKLFGKEPPEKEIFASASFKAAFSKHVDFEAIAITNQKCDHHRWFDEIEKQMACKRPEVLVLAARAYLDGISDAMQKGLIEEIKASAP
jgi:hypothetical protein